MEIDINTIARLARIHLNDAEKKRYQEELSAVLDYVDTLSALSLEDVEVTTHAVEQSGVMRSDTVAPHLERTHALQNAPDHDGAHVIVPRVV